MASNHKNIAMVVGFFLFLIGLVVLLKVLRSTKEVAEDGASKVRKSVKKNDDTVEFENQMFDGENHSRDMENPELILAMADARSSGMFDTEYQAESPTKSKKGMSQSEKNKSRKNASASKKEQKIIAKQEAMEMEEDAAGAKAKEQRRKEKVKEKKKKQKGGGRADRDLGKLVTTKEDFNKEIAQTRKEFENGNDRTYKDNKSMLGNIVHKKGEQYSASIDKEKDAHKAKGTQRGGGGGLI
jgi:hypothetical protein